MESNHFSQQLDKTNGWDSYVGIKRFVFLDFRICLLSNNNKINYLQPSSGQYWPGGYNGQY